MLNQSQAIQLYLTNRDKFPRMSQTEAINMIRRTGGIPADTSAPPEAALATAATLPVETAAEPAPPAVEQEQPAPAQPYRGPAAAALEAFNKINPAQAAQPPAGGKVDFAELARLRGLEAKRNELKMAADLEGQAAVDPEMQALIDKRSGRIDAELQSMDEDRKQAVWMAIAQAGMKMAQSQSPYFMQALASGMEAGLTGYNADKAKAAEKKARLQDQKEDLALEMLKARRQAGVEAVTAYNAARQGAAAEQAMEAGALKNLVMGETADEQIAEAGLRNQMIREQIASARQSRALAIEAARRARAAGGGSPLGKAYASGIGNEAEYGRKYAENVMEQSDLRPGDEGYTRAFQAAVSEGRSIFRNSNPQWSSIANAVEKVPAIQRPAPKAPPQPPKKEQSWFSSLFN